MKFALICPNEPVANGCRVAQVEVEVFPVGEPTYWLECSDDVVADLWYFDDAAQQIIIVPIKNGLQPV